MVFYTGQDALCLDEAIFQRMPGLKLLKGRPDISTVMRSVMCSIELNEDLPQKMLIEAERFQQEVINNRKHQTLKQKLMGMMRTYSPEELFELALANAFLTEG